MKAFPDQNSYFLHAFLIWRKRFADSIPSLESIGIFSPAGVSTFLYMVFLKPAVNGKDRRDLQITKERRDAKWSLVTVVKPRSDYLATLHQIRYL